MPAKRCFYFDPLEDMSKEEFIKESFGAYHGQTFEATLELTGDEAGKIPFLEGQWLYVTLFFFFFFVRVVCVAMCVCSACVDTDAVLIVHAGPLSVAIVSSHLFFLHRRSRV
jgi:hypothetical protein